MITSFALTAAQAAGHVPGHGPPPGVVDKVDGQVLEAAERDGRVTFWALLAEQADLTPAYSLDWQERGRFVYESLRATAAESQEPIADLLRGRGVAHEAFWIVNAVKVSGGLGLVQDLAARPEVARIAADGVFELVEPVEATAAEPSDEVEWGIASIGADRVWRDVGVQGEGIVVGIIDTGALFDHPALITQYRGDTGDGTFDHNHNWHDPSGVCEDFAGTADEPCDNDGHGTHVTGTVLGWDGGTNRIGVAPAARWIAAKGCESRSCSRDATLSSGEFMLAPTDLQGNNADPDRRPHIVNNSWGSRGGGHDPYFQGIVEAWQAAGIFPVFSNGNDGPGCQSAGNPANYPESYGVGAHNHYGEIADFSSRGPGPDELGRLVKPDVAAPGVDVRSAYGDGGYRALSGTSMAAPHVAGSVALVWAAAPALIGEVSETRSLLNSTADGVVDLQCGGMPEHNNVWGHGQLNALDAVRAAPAQPTGLLSGTVLDEDDDPVASAEVEVSRDGFRRIVHSGTDGSYQVALSVGTYDVGVRAFGLSEATASGVEVVASGSTRNFTLVPAPLATLSGTVSDQHGMPVAGATVTLVDTPLPPATTSEGGGYVLEDVPAGAYEMVVEDGPCVLSERLFAATGSTDGVIDVELPMRADAFGYFCRTIDAGYETAGNVLDVPVADGSAFPPDPIAEIEELPFDFPYYGQDYTSAWVCGYGFITFVEESCTHLSRRLPSTGAPKGGVFAFWDRFEVDEGASIRTAARGSGDDHRFVIEFRNMAFRGLEDSRVDFNVILFESGEIRMQYRNLDPNEPRELGDRAVVGIQNHDSTIGHTYLSSDPLLHDGLTVQYLRGPTATLSVTVTDANDGQPLGDAPLVIRRGAEPLPFLHARADDSGELELTLPLGTHRVEARPSRYRVGVETVNLRTENERVTVGFALGTSLATTDPDELAFADPIETVMDETLSLTNVGTDLLVWELLTLPQGESEPGDVPWLDADRREGVLLEGQRQTLQLTVDRTDLAPGLHTATLRLATNSGSQPSVDVPVSLWVHAYYQPVNAGGDRYTAVDGEVWGADQLYTEGSWGYASPTAAAVPTPRSISGTDDDLLYQTVRQAPQAYRFDGLEPGPHEVQLRFAEVAQRRASVRRFDVWANGALLLGDYNIVSAAGASHTAADHVFLVEVEGNDLLIEFVRQGGAHPILNAIRVLDQPPQE